MFTIRPEEEIALLRFLEGAQAGQQDTTLAGLITRLRLSPSTLHVSPLLGLGGLSTPVPTPSPTSAVPNECTAEEVVGGGMESGGEFSRAHGCEAYGVRHLRSKSWSMSYMNLCNSNLGLCC